MMPLQYVIVALIVAGAAIWLGYRVYRTFTGKGSGACSLCDKCFPTGQCPPEKQPQGKEPSES